MGCEREKAGGQGPGEKKHTRGEEGGGAESGRRVAGEQLDARAEVFTHATRFYPRAAALSAGVRCARHACAGGAAYY